jgi:hypothetical protein
MLLCAGAFPAGAAEGAFAGMTGYWSGGGTISVANGTSERIRCKAQYAVDGSGTNLNQSLRCASDSYKFEVNSNLANAGGTISGSWMETTHNAGGNVSGRVSGGTISGSVSGVGFNATLSVATHGNQQTVTIRPTGSTDIRDVTVTLKRS